MYNIKRCLLLGRKAMTNLDRVLKSRDITLLTKVHVVKAMAFPAVIYGCAIKKAECQRIDAFKTVVLEKTLESPLDSKEIKSVNPKNQIRNQPLIFIGRTDAEAEALILWPPDGKSWLVGKDPEVEKDWGQGKGVTEHEMVEWHHRLNGHEFEQTSGDSEGQGSLACCSAWGHKKSDMTEWATTTTI